MQSQQVILIAAAVLALVAVVAAARLEHPEPNADICPGQHTPDTCKVCCKSFHYLQHVVQEETYACVCDTYYNTRGNFFNGEHFDDRDTIEILQKPFDSLDEDLALKKKSLEKAKLYSNIDPSKVPARRELVEKMEALVKQTKSLAKEYYELSN